MTEWTLGYIAEAIVFMAGLIGGLGVLYSTLKKWLAKVIEQQTEAIVTELESLNKRLDIQDLETTKNYLVQFISEVRRGEVINEAERQRFYEQYEHYLEKGGNTYIKTEVEKLRKKELI